MTRTSRPPRPATDDPQLARLIRAEQLRVLFVHTPLPIWLATGFAVGLAWAVHRDLGATKVGLWLALKVVIAAGRLLQARLYARSEHRQDAHWYRVYLALLFVDGAVWGLAGVWLLPADRLDLAALIAACMLGAAALSSFVLQADSRANALFVLPMVLPIAYSAFTRADVYGLFGGWSVLGFVAILLWEGRLSERGLVQMLWLRFTTDRVSQERAQALARAERLSAVKSQFLATMSHEMRTPLHGILGLTRLVHSKEANPELRAHLELAERSGQHLLNVINDVLDFSKIDAGHLHIEPHPFELHAVIDDVVALWRVAAQQKGLDLRVQLELAAPCWVEGDAARVRQVLHNLLGNAIKFTGQGHVALRVRPHPASNVVCIEVEDTGIGIAAHDLPRIFDAFHQLEAGADRRFGGSGLGLTIAREISRAMGGDLRCASRPMHGSTFTFEVPLPPTASVEAPVAPASAQGHTTASAAAPRASSGGPRQLRGRVLLAEDNPVNALLAQTTLRKLGLEVRSVTNGQAAIEAIKNEAARGASFDVVLMDCQMPLMDGFEATRQIRALDLGPRPVPIIALTASALEDDRERCLAAGMNDHLPKPFGDTQLAALLSSYLSPVAGPAA